MSQILIVVVLLTVSSIHASIVLLYIACMSCNCFFCVFVAEYELAARVQELASKNCLFRSYIGMGYYNCITPPVIKRNIIENPGWSVSINSWTVMPSHSCIWLSVIILLLYEELAFFHSPL